MAKGDTKTNQYLDIAANGTRADLPTDTCCETRSQTLIREVAERIMDVEDEVEEIKNNPDVVDIVATYADLQAYDTQHLTDKDIIRVLQDETHDGDSTYYRYNAQSSTWTYVGESKQYEDFVGTDGTTAGEAGLVPAPATTDAGKFLKADGTWGTAAGGGGIVELTSADYNYPTDNPTTVALWLLNEGVYTPSTNSVSIKENGSVGAGVGKAQALYIISDEDLNGWKYVTVINPRQNSTGENIVTSYKLLPSTGSVNTTITSLYSNNVVQTTGTSTTDVMSQDATTKMVFADPSTTQKVQIGNSASAGGNNSVAVGYGASSGGPAATAIGRSANSEGSQSTAVGFESVARGTNAIALGHGATASNSKDGTVSVGASAGANSGNASYSTQIGYFARATGNGGIALGSYSSASAVGEMNIGSTSTNYGYNSSNYRLLTGLYDGQSDHDAVNLGQLNGRVKQNAGAPTTSTAGSVGTLYEDTTNGKLYQCTAVSGNTYTWTEVGAGGGSSGVIELTSADYDYHREGNTDDGVALWRLEPGMYVASGPVKVYLMEGGGGNAYVRDSGQKMYFISNIGSGEKIIFEVYNGKIEYFQVSPVGALSADVPYPRLTDIFKDINKIEVRIGYGSAVTGAAAVAIGRSSEGANKGSIALGAYSRTSSQGEMNIGATNTGYGYNSSNYRLLTGVYDPQSAHDAANKEYVDPTTDSSAPTTATVGRLGQIQIDTTTATAYMCVAVDTVTPSYTWKQITA